MCMDFIHTTKYPGHPSSLLKSISPWLVFCRSAQQQLGGAFDYQAARTQLEASYNELQHLSAAAAVSASGSSSGAAAAAVAGGGKQHGGAALLHEEENDIAAALPPLVHFYEMEDSWQDLAAYQKVGLIDGRWYLVLGIWV